MDPEAICQGPVTLHAKRRRRMRIGKKKLCLRGRQPEVTHQSKVSILIELIRLTVKPINKAPELALLRSDFAQDGGCFARLMTTYSVQRPMAKDHLHVVWMR